MLSVLLFDLDDTLYHPATGLWPAIGLRINAFMVERLGLPPEAVARMRQVYMETYGTTLNGLQHDYGIDADDYLAFVHNLPLERYLEPSPDLGQMLARLPQRKVIFTNADAPHARRVITQLGVAEHFERIVDLRALNFVNKPDPRAYQQVLALTGAAPAECMFIDDAVRNLRPAHDIGMTAVLVSPAGGPRPAGIDQQIDSILDLEGLLLRIEPGLASAAGPVVKAGRAEP
jgi:putative hydrolase of the HAD superfamily